MIKIVIYYGRKEILQITSYQGKDMGPLLTAHKFQIPCFLLFIILHPGIGSYACLVLNHFVNCGYCLSL